MKRIFCKTLRSFIVAVGLLLPVGVSGQSYEDDACVSLSASASEGTVFTLINTNESAYTGDYPQLRRLTGLSDLSNASYGAVWRHNQIPFEMVVSATCFATYSHAVPLNSSNGKLPLWMGDDDAAAATYLNTITTTKLDGKMVICYPYENGNPDFCIGVSLPQGYRFTRYDITVRPITTDEAVTLGISDEYENVLKKTYSEEYFKTRKYYFDKIESPKALLDIINNYGWYETCIGTVKNGTPARLRGEVNSRNLFFSCNCNHADENDLDDYGIAAIVIEDAKFYYECEPFDWLPLNTDINATQNGFLTTFDTGLSNLGKIYMQTDDNSVKHYGFIMNKKSSVEPFDMESAAMLYDASKLSAGTPSLEADDDAKIEACDSSATDGALYALKCGTYYVESAAAMSKDGKSMVVEGSDESLPAGYRITGLKLTEEFDDEGLKIKMGSGYLGESSISNRTTDPDYYKFYSSESAVNLWYIEDGKLYTYDGDTKKYLKIYSGADLAKLNKGWVIWNDFSTSTYYITEWIDTSAKNLFDNNNIVGTDGSFVITDSGILTTTIDGKNYYVDFVSGDAFLKLVEYTDATSITSNVVAQHIVSAISKTNWGGTKVEVFTNSDTEPLVTLTKKTMDSDFDLTDGNSQTTVATTNTTDEFTFTLGDATDAKNYINNDAIKIVVSDDSGTPIEGETYAALRISLRLEPLNPFISSVKIADEDGLGTEQTAGAEGTELVPGENCDMVFHANSKLKFTALHKQSLFDLSNYGGGSSTGMSMYGLVKSDKYSEDNTMFSSSDAVAGYIETDYMPTSMFAYNNLSNMDENGAYLANNLFKESSATFGYASLNYPADASGKSFYLVSNDKPAFNITRATALRHQSYAYYTTTLKAKGCAPALTFKKIYDKTFHDNAVDESPYYGVVVGIDKDNSTSTTNYLTVNQIDGAISEKIEDATVTAKPADKAHILYVEASGLDRLLSGEDEGLSGNIYTDLRKKLAVNAFVYVPSREVTDTNVVKKSDDSYTATANVRLKDKQPMFIPTAFTKPSGGNYVEYVRNFTDDLDGRVSLNTFVLPMALPVTDGAYDGKLNLYTLKTSDCLTTTKKGEGTDYYDNTATFTPVSGAATVANTPYLAVVKSGNELSEDNKTFTIKLTDEVEIAATGTPRTDGTAIKGGTSSGSVNGSTVSFTSYGTYSGAALPKDDGYFYFGKDKLYMSNNLAETYPNVLMYPFRVYYDFETSGNAKNIAVLDVNLDNGETTGISTTDADGGKSVVVTTGDGTITLTALTDTNVAVYAVAGQCIDRRGMVAGESRTIATGSGLYVVNGQKVTVK